MTSPLPTPDGRSLDEWNATDVSYPGPPVLHAAFERLAAERADDVAVVFGEESVSYGSLNARANRLSRWLLDVGVARGTPVGVFMERSVEMVVALYAIVKAGAAYVPLDPEYPSERLGFMVEDAAAPVVLVQAHLSDALPAMEATVFAVDTEAASLAGYSAENPDLDLAGDDAAYVIFTSGSTGRPKGVMNTHRGIHNRLMWMQESFGLDGSDVVLQKTPFSFDVSVWEFFWPLMVGSRLVVAEPGGHRDAGYLVRMIVAHGVTTVHFVPSMLRLFLEHPEVGSCDSLRRVICSGEALSVDLQERFFTRLETRLFNLYGPTEAAVDVTFWECRRGDDSPVVPIGWPVANTQIHILDEALRRVPIGATGELHIGGVQVAAGYVNRPELTEERFIADPFGDRPGARLYKTGDLARFRPDGAIEFLGRADFQVKIRGNRIELGEIEAALDAHPDVAHAVVTAEDDHRGGQRLVGHVVCGDTRPSVGELRTFLESTLPGYMVPGRLVFHDAFQLTSSGKVDRRALAAVGRERPALDTVFRPARDPLEQFLVSQWSELLDLETVGINDRFFDLGGDSLQAAEFVGGLQETLDEFIYVITVFQWPTIAEYAAFLRRDYAAAVEARFQLAPTTPNAGRGRSPGGRALTLADADRLYAAVPGFAPFERWSRGEPNPQAIFILSPPRSGTSLLRVMLAGHPQLFAASELQLLGFDTLHQRRAAYSGRHSLWLEGTIRAVMELKDIDAEAAKAVMERYEAADTSAKDFYRELDTWIGSRTLVDKSPSYAMQPEVLANAERGFSGARYIQLVRDPHAMVRSFESYHMDQVLFLEDHPYSPAQLGELVWLLSHRNISEFFEGVPEERKYRVHFEDLVTKPEETMRDLCAAMGVEYHDAVVRPYDDLDRKMVDGIHRQSIPMGDTRLLEHGRIDASVTRRWNDADSGEFLSAPTLELAAGMGYGPTDEPRQRGRNRRQLVAQSRRRGRREPGSGS